MHAGMPVCRVAATPNSNSRVGTALRCARSCMRARARACARLCAFVQGGGYPQQQQPAGYGPPVRAFVCACACCLRGVHFYEIKLRLIPFS